MTKDERRDHVLFLAAAIALGLVGQWGHGLMETDEGRYAECARGMVESGDWLVPRLDGYLHLTKPPGAYWAAALGISVLGPTTLAARLVLGLAHAAAILGVRSAGRSLLGAAAGNRAGWIFAGMLFPFAAGSILTTDMFLTAAVAWACAAALRGSTGWLLLSGAFAGLAAFFKGPVAWLGYASFLAAWVVFVRPAAPSGERRRVISLPGVLTALVVGLGWFAWAARNVPGALDHFMGHEIAGRLTTAGDHEPRPLWFYPAVLVAGCLPWWAPAWRGFRGALSDATGKALLVWFAAPLVLFSAFPSKNWFYVLPLTIPLAMIAARGSRDRDSGMPGRPGVVVAWCALLVAGRFAAAYVPTGKDMSVLSAAVDRADGGRGLPVAVLTGRDVRGLFYYRRGDVVRLRAKEVRKDRADSSLERFATDRAAARGKWLLVAEGGEEESVAISRVLGETAALREDVRGWRLYEVSPPTEKR